MASRAFYERAEQLGRETDDQADVRGQRIENVVGNYAANPMAMALVTADMPRWVGTRDDGARLARAGDITEVTVALLIADGTLLTAKLARREKGSPAASLPR